MVLPDIQCSSWTLIVMDWCQQPYLECKGKLQSVECITMVWLWIIACASGYANDNTMHKPYYMDLSTSVGCCYASMWWTFNSSRTSLVRGKDFPSLECFSRKLMLGYMMPGKMVCMFSWPWKSGTFQSGLCLVKHLLSWKSCVKYLLCSW